MRLTRWAASRRFKSGVSVPESRNSFSPISFTGTSSRSHSTSMVQLRDVWSEEIEQALAGKKTAKQALDAAVERGNTMLRQFEKTAVR